jgi:hypothetical protein
MLPALRKNGVRLPFPFASPIEGLLSKNPSSLAAEILTIPTVQLVLPLTGVCSR